MKERLYKEAQGYADETGNMVRVRIFQNGKLGLLEDFLPSRKTIEKVEAAIDKEIEDLKKKKESLTMTTNNTSALVQGHQKKIMGDE